MVSHEQAVLVAWG